LTDPALFANYVYNAFQFPSHALIGLDHRIERVGNLSRGACPIVRESRRKITAFERHQSREQLARIEISSVSFRAISQSRFCNKGSFFHKVGCLEKPASSLSPIRRGKIRIVIFQRRRNG